MEQRLPSGTQLISPDSAARLDNELPAPLSTETSSRSTAASMSISSSSDDEEAPTPLPVSSAEEGEIMSHSSGQADKDSPSSEEDDPMSELEQTSHHHDPNPVRNTEVEQNQDIHAEPRQSEDAVLDETSDPDPVLGSVNTSTGGLAVSASESPPANASEVAAEGSSDSCMEEEEDPDDYEPPEALVAQVDSKVVEETKPALPNSGVDEHEPADAQMAEDDEDYNPPEEVSELVTQSQPRLLPTSASMQEAPISEEMSTPGDAIDTNVGAGMALAGEGSDSVSMVPQPSQITD